MATDRTTIIRGPGSVTYGGQTLFDANGINASLDSSTGEIPSSVSGNIGTMKTDQTGKVTLTPCGQVSAALVALLFPYGNPTIGSSACGSTDRPLVVHSLAGTKVSFLNAVLSKMPEIYLSPVKTAFGSLEFSAALAKGKAPGDANSLYKVETGTYGLGAPDPSGIVGVQYSAEFGDLTIDDTADGWTVTPEVTLQPVVVDSVGTIDWTIADVACTAKCTPIGLTEAQILAALPVAQARGSLVGGSDDLVITGGTGGLTVTLKNASLVQGPLQWGNTALRVGEIGFTAHRSFSSGTPGPLFTVAYNAPTSA